MGYAFAHYNLGTLLDDHFKDYNGARSAYERAIEIDPNYANAHNNLGALLENHFKDYDGARSAYERAIEIDPNHKIARDNLQRLRTSLSTGTKSAPKDATISSD